MAKNYNVFEVVELLVENKDAEALLDVGKRYPLLTQKLLRIAAVAGDALLDFASFLPENLTANRINGLIKKSIAAGEDVEDDDAEFDAGTEEDDDAEEKPAKKVGKKPAKEKAKAASKKSDDDTDDKDYDSMSNAQMYKLLGDLGLRKDCKAKYGDLSHDSMLNFLKGMDGDAAESDDEEDAGDAGSYDEMSVVELYKECKKRGIKAEQKKPAKYYIGLLEKDDAKSAEPEEDESDDDWGDDDEEDTKPAKKADKKPIKEKGKSATKKKAPMPEPEDDDDEDDDWDI